VFGAKIKLGWCFAGVLRPFPGVWVLFGVLVLLRGLVRLYGSYDGRGFGLGFGLVDDGRGFGVV